MSKLNVLRSQLAALKRKRQMARWAMAWSAMVVAVVCALLVIFALDFGFNRLQWYVSPLQRVILMVVAGGVLVWAFYRFTKPFLGTKETELDMALLVEKQQRIDSDLVAALQFESSPDARQWGSAQLETAVIDYVADVGRGLNVFEGFRRDRAVRRSLAMLAALAVVALLAVLFPRHLQVFLSRLGLADIPYPSNTVIERVIVNANDLGARPDQATAVRSAFSKPIAFRVLASGTIPDSGEVKIRFANSGQEEIIDLVAAGKDSAGHSVFTGEFQKLLDPVNFQLYLGDAWTTPAKIDVISLPVVEVKFVADPPQYALGSEDIPPINPGSLQMTVLEGSTLKLDLTCKNRKPLKKAWMQWGDEKIDLVPADEQKLAWKLPTRTKPFAAPVKKSAIKENGAEPAKEPDANPEENQTEYSIHVEDEDGLGIEPGIKGQVYWKKDAQPGIAGKMHTKVVMPDGRPTIELQAWDDFSLGKLKARLDITRLRRDAQGVETEVVEQREIPIQSLLPIEDQIQPSSGKIQPKLLPTPMRGRKVVGGYRLDILPSLKLSKGDKIDIWLMAEDFRGPTAGKSGTADQPLQLRISDEAGVLAANEESDLEADKLLTETILLQTGNTETNK